MDLGRSFSCTASWLTPRTCGSRRSRQEEEGAFGCAALVCRCRHTVKSAPAVRRSVPCARCMQGACHDLVSRLTASSMAAARSAPKRATSAACGSCCTCTPKGTGRNDDHAFVPSLPCQRMPPCRLKPSMGSRRPRLRPWLVQHSRNPAPALACPAVVHPSASSCSPSLPPNPRSLDRGKSCREGRLRRSIRKQAGRSAGTDPYPLQHRTWPQVPALPHLSPLPAPNWLQDYNPALACMACSTERGGITVCWLGLCCTGSRAGQGGGAGEIRRSSTRTWAQAWHGAPGPWSCIKHRGGGSPKASTRVPCVQQHALAPACQLSTHPPWQSRSWRAACWSRCRLRLCSLHKGGLGRQLGGRSWHSADGGRSGSRSARAAAGGTGKRMLGAAHGSHAPIWSRSAPRRRHAMPAPAASRRSTSLDGSRGPPRTTEFQLKASTDAPAPVRLCGRA